MTYSLTPRQADALRFIAGFQLANSGVSPSLAEIKEGLGIKGCSNTEGLLKGLEERGWIRRMPGNARAIEVLHPLPVPRSPDGAPLHSIRLPS